jgi:hypothetical protein
VFKFHQIAALFLSGRRSGCGMVSAFILRASAIFRAFQCFPPSLHTFRRLRCGAALFGNGFNNHRTFIVALTQRKVAFSSTSLLGLLRWPL